MKDRRNIKEDERVPVLMFVVSAITLVIAGISSVWLLLATQSPSSPLHVGPLVGPIGTLVVSCWIAGFGGLAIATSMSVLNLKINVVRRITKLLAVGWSILMIGLILGAILGTSGTQVIKAYPRTLTVLLIKIVGFLPVLMGLVSLLFSCMRRWRRND